MLNRRYLRSQINNDCENAITVQQDFELFYETQCYPLNKWAIKLFRLGSSFIVIAGGLLMCSTLAFSFGDSSSTAVFGVFTALTVIGPMALGYLYPVDAESNRTALLTALQEAQVCPGWGILLF